MDKIYSRKRFIIKPIGRFCGKNANLKNIKFAKKIIKFISIILIGVYGFKIGFDYLEPVYEAMCNEKVKYITFNYCYYYGFVWHYYDIFGIKCLGTI
jgi:hypothetical protein